MKRDPNWTAEEIVLATEVLLKNEFRVVGAQHPDVIELSNLLNRLPIHASGNRKPSFRSPSSIDLKLANIRSKSPTWAGGSMNASRLDDYFWRVLGGNEELLAYEASSIRAKYGLAAPEDRVFVPKSPPVPRPSSDPQTNSIDSLPIEPIHRERLQWFRDREGSTISYNQLSSVKNPFLVSRPTGIYRPSGWDYALSVRETLASDYGDVAIRNLPNGDWVYRYHEEDGQNLPTNLGLQACLRDQVPIGVLIQVQAKPSARYMVAGLGLIYDYQKPWFDIAKWDSETALQLLSRDQHDSPVEQRDLAPATSAPSFLNVAMNETYSRQLVRPNQPLFRFMLLNSYDHQCAITDSKVVPVLEAAHIRPYRYDRIDSIQNGLLLRADVHRLFDCGLLGVNTSRMETVISNRLIGSEYERYAEKPLKIPTDQQQQPSTEYLDEHRKHWELN